MMLTVLFGWITIQHTSTYTVFAEIIFLTVKNDYRGTFFTSYGVLSEIKSHVCSLDLAVVVHRWHECFLIQAFTTTEGIQKLYFCQ